MTTTVLPAEPQAATPAAGRPPANILAIASGKGGVGKTWFAITLAHALSRLGRRTLLFDGDLGLANVDIQLGLTPQRDLGGVLAGRLSLQQAVQFFEPGFEIIAGRSGCGKLAALPEARLIGLAEELTAAAGDYEHVVLDLGAGVERTVRRLSALAATCIVVVTDEPTSLTDAYAFIKVAQLERLPSAMQVVVNLAGSARAGEKTYAALLRACTAFLGIAPPLLGVVRRDARVREAIRSQAPLLTRFPACEAAADVQGIAAVLAGLAAPPPGPGTRR